MVLGNKINVAYDSIFYIFSNLGNAKMPTLQTLFITEKLKFSTSLS